MKKILICLMLFVSLFMFVSCPSPEEPSVPEIPADPVNERHTPFHTYDEFLSFARGCWKRIDDDIYLWISPNQYHSSDYVYGVYDIVSVLGLTPESFDFFNINPTDSFPYDDVFNVDSTYIGFIGSGGGCVIFHDAKPYGDGYCYDINDHWYYKVSSDWTYDPSSGSGSGSGSGSSSSLSDYAGDYTFSNATGNQSNGSISINGSSWSYNSSKAGNTITTGTVEMDGNNVKLNFTVSGISQSETFTVTINGSSATWRSTNSYVSTLFSALFGVSDLEMTFSYVE